MDADGRKRKASAAATLRKKPRRDKSEFVSVEAGMRAFRKRLASGAAAGETKTELEDLTQDVKGVRTRAKKVPPRKPTAVKKTEEEATKKEVVKKKTVRKTPVKKTTAAAKKTAVAAVKKTPVKRQGKTTAKMTLAEVKKQLEKEQKERVESRIQTLHRDATPSTTETVAAVDISVVETTPSTAASTATTTAAVDTLTSRNDSVVNSAAQQGQVVEPVVEELVMPTLAQPVPSGSVDAQAIAPSAIPAAHAAIVADPVVAADPPPNAGKNEFIADDLDEDFMFAMALEEVERKLATPQKAPVAIEPMASTESNTLASASVQGPTVSHAPAKVPPQAQTPPSQTVETTPQQLPEAAVEVKQETTAVQMAPEVLEEMERLRKENELLRRSNELLQAAVTSPTHAEPPADEEFGHAREHLDTHNGKKDRASPTMTSSDFATASSAARYLDLGRCDSDHEVDQTTKVSEGNQPQECTMARSSENHNGRDQFGENAQVEESAGNFARVQDQQFSDEGSNHPTEPNILAKGPPELSISVVAKKKTTTTSLPASPASSDDDYSSQRQDPVQEDKHASRVLANPIEPEVEISTRSTTEGDVSDASMSEVEEEDDDVEEGNEDNGEIAIEDEDLTSRTSTIDSGNYTKYKVHQEEELEDADDEEMEDTHDSNIVRSVDTVERASPTTASTDTKTIKMVIESDVDQVPGTPVNSDIIGRTTAPSNSDEDEDEDEVVTTVKRRGRRAVITYSTSSSSSSSESESGSDEEGEGDTRSTNVLEAALRAAGGESDRKNQPKALSSTESTAVSDKKPVPSVAASSPSLGAKTTSKKRKISGLTSSSKRPPSVKSSLLWPALDEFYDFILDLTPRNVRGSEKKRVHLQQYAGGKLPVQHSTIENYCDVQLEAIMEELVASVSDSTDRRGSGRSGPTRQLSLTSVSPCGVQASTSSLGLSFGAIFSESGFTGSTSSNNDYILTFDASALGKKSSSDFMSGDLVLVSSPRWKNYEMCVFGVVLCDSVVAVGGKSYGKSGNNGGGGSDQICVLIRAQMREDAVENFNVLTELCLSNQRVANWKWSLQQVHNTTTSAREFQAIKAISFLPNDLKQVLLRGKLVPSSKTEQTSKKLPLSTSILSPRLLKYLHKHYNDSQMQAIIGCLGEDSRVIIQGPPGTGKTKTILGLLSALLDGAGLSTLQKAKGTARIRVGASLQSARTSAVSKTVAETSIRILVAAPSNAAVDELVVRVLSEGLFDGEKGESYRPRIVRVGRPESNQQQSGLAAAREASESKKNRKKMRKYAREVEEVLLESLVTKHRCSFPTIKQTRQAIIKNAQIVFCTLSGAGSVAMCEFAHDFDALIIDEAAQAVEASTLIPFKFRPHRVVLVGDHRQLPATVISKKLVSMGYDRSLQQRLVENGSPVRLLTKQYRMHPEIAEFPSSFFYEGRLVQDANMREWTAQDYHRDRAFKPLLFLDVQGAQSQVSGSTSLRNLSEVEVVVQLVRRLLKKFPNIEWRKRIGVIAPYKQQIFEVRGALGRLESECDRSLGIEVNTVDGFQGREKEIIIYSCVRTSHGGRRKKKRRSHSGNDEEDDVLDAFWADERRMNVAITRAKSSLWIVGNSTLLQQSRAWRALIQHTKNHNRYVSDAAATLLAAGTRKASSNTCK